MSEQTLTPRHLMTALIVVLLWGMNFVVIKIGLKGIPPLLMGGLRFSLVAIPSIFFIPRPTVPWKLLVTYALTISLGQFAFLFSAMSLGMPAGLASLVLQSQAFFTVGLSAMVFGDRLRTSNLIGMLIASLGLALLGSISIHQTGSHVTLIGFLLTLCAAASWATGNVINKKIGPTAVLSLVSWSALVPILPFFALSFYFEGEDAIAFSLRHMTLPSVLSLAYLAFAATLIGYTLWGKLLSALPTHTVAPLTLLVPVVGLTTAWVILGEALTFLQVIGAMVVMGGLLVNVFGLKLWNAMMNIEARP